MWKLEVLPHGMWRIRHAPVREGVSSKQIAEFIIPARGRNAKHGNQRDAKGNHQQPDHHDGQDFAPCQPPKAVFHILKAGGLSPGAAGIA